MKKRFWHLITISIVLISLFSLAKSVQAQTPQTENPVYIYLFWGDGCPHCAKAKPYFENLAAAHPEIVLHTYEVYYDAENQKLFTEMAQKYGVEQLAVPTIFVGPYFLQGYSEEYNPHIEEIVLGCLSDGCVDAGAEFMTEVTAALPTAEASISGTNPPLVTPTTFPATQAAPTAVESAPSAETGGMISSGEVEIPLLGKVNLASKSLWVSTFLIALVDGVNPCSLWVLTMLLALTLHTGSRKKVFVIGLIFLTVTAGIYVLFIVGLFSVLKITHFLGWIRILLALVALGLAMVNIKDYFWYKEGLSLTIADDKKPGIFKKLRGVMDAGQSFGGMVAATVTLAAGVSLIEFSCTAGFPLVWTNLLNAQNVSGTTFVLLLLLYMVIYQLDEMVIFFASVATLKTSRVEEKHGRILKLISGVLMVTLAIVLLVNPSLMNNLSSSLLIFGIALLATLAVLLIHRVLLPKIGIHIGTEFSQKKAPSQRKNKP